MTAKEPILTERLVLRRPVTADAPAIARHAGDRAVARWTANIPHPYAEGEAERFLARLAQDEAAGRGRTFAVALREAPADLIGMAGFEAGQDGRIEIGYWLARPYWGKGLMSEAVTALAAFAETWRPGAAIFARTFPDNPASQRVLEKAGFVRAGTGVCCAPARPGGEIADAPEFVRPRDSGWAGS